MGFFFPKDQQEFDRHDVSMYGGFMFSLGLFLSLLLFILFIKYREEPSKSPCYITETHITCQLPPKEEKKGTK